SSTGTSCTTSTTIRTCRSTTGRSTPSFCAVSVQYLVRPVDVFRDVTRVLRPDGPLIVSFSNRCFPTKAVALWLGADDAGHRQIARAYLEGAGLESVVDEQLPTPDDPVYLV